ncbi:unnamed protein product [Phyllotreta striolata]|uniref:Phosphoglycerate mutase n=1 Tax=Phyllotreta striolata TaxID=444603 RepID=A0A9N9TQ67_PHYSR|nr:unnamed protein product [Phyllotreta striolata]
MTSNCPVIKKCLDKANSAEYCITMCRHGESEWNQKNLFCGWYNANLSKKGHEEAKRAGKAIKDEGIKFDIAYTSVLKRAQDTLNHILEVSGQTKIPIVSTWRLNERHYGGLTGQNKVEAVETFGEEQVAIWRRSYDVPPPEMEPEHPFYDDILNDPIYKDGPPREKFPKTESLKLCIERSMPFFYSTVIPQLKKGKNVIIAAHGNSLRGIVKSLERMTPEQIMGLNLPTGIPFQYRLDGLFRPIGTMRFLGDEETVTKAIEEVANQTKKK